MTKPAIFATVTGLLLGGTALAGPIEDIVTQFQSYGYDAIEIRQSGDLVKIEGVRDGTEREIVFDTASNTILSDETGQTGSNDDESDDDDDSDDDSGDDAEDDHHEDGEDDDGEDHHDDHDDNDDHDHGGDDHRDHGEDDESDD